MFAEFVFITILAFISVRASITMLGLVKRFWLALVLSVAVSASIWVVFQIAVQIAVTHPFLDWGEYFAVVAVLVPIICFLSVWKAKAIADRYDSGLN